MLVRLFAFRNEKCGSAWKKWLNVFHPSTTAGTAKPIQKEAVPEEVGESPSRVRVGHQEYGEVDHGVGQPFILRPLFPEDDRQAGACDNERGDDAHPPEERFEPDVPCRLHTGPQAPVKP